MTISYPRIWPAGLGIQRSRFGLSKNEAAFEGPLARQVNVFSHAAGTTDRWEGILTTLPMSEDNVAILSALGVSLGVKNTIELFDPDRREARSGVMPGGGFTNWALWSNSFDSASTWVPSGASVVANTDGSADDVTDNDAGAAENIRQAIPVPDDSETYTVSLRIKKTGTTVMGLNANLIDGTTPVSAIGRFDVAAGNSNIGNVVDETTYWRWDFPVTNNQSGNTTLAIVIYPALRATLGGADDVAQTGTITIKEAQIERASSVGAFESTTGGPKVKGASQTGKSLATDGWKASSTILLAGDYVQIGSGFHMILADVASDGSGNATLDFEPAMRSSPADNAAITVINPVLVARLTSPDFFWETGPMKNGPISFAFEEVV